MGLLSYKKLGLFLIIIGIISIIIRSFILNGLYYIFFVRFPKYGWSGPNITAWDMLINLLISIFVIFILTILPGICFYKFSKKKIEDNLFRFSKYFSVIAHAIMIIIIAFIGITCLHSCTDEIGIVLAFGLISYFFFGGISVILLIIYWFRNR